MHTAARSAGELAPGFRKTPRRLSANSAADDLKFIFITNIWKNWSRLSITVPTVLHLPSLLLHCSSVPVFWSDGGYSDRPCEPAGTGSCWLFDGHNHRHLAADFDNPQSSFLNRLYRFFLKTANSICSIIGEDGDFREKRIMDKKKRKRAFTLIELLVVLAIIMPVLSIVVPSLRKAKASARAVVCKTALRNSTFVHYTYFTENNTLMPISVNDPVMRPWFTFDVYRSMLGLHVLEPEYKTRRTGQLQEYKPSYPQKFICPSARVAFDTAEDGLYPIDRSYGLNAHVFYFEDYVRRRLTSQSAGILSMADALDWWFNCWQCDKYAEYGEQWLGFETYGTAAFRHSKKANVAYWDGHVEQMTAEELKDDLNEWLTLANRK